MNPDLIVPTCVAGFKDLKEKIMKKEKEFNNTKIIFFDEMCDTEDIIYKYYSSNFKNSKETSLSESNKTEKKQKDVITEEAMNNKINNAKKLEEKYKKEAEDAIKMENDFINISKFYAESVKKMSDEMFEKLKNLMLKFLNSIKNNFKTPETKIESILPELAKLDSSLKIEKIIEKHYHDKK